MFFFLSGLALSAVSNGLVLLVFKSRKIVFKQKMFFLSAGDIQLYICIHIHTHIFETQKHPMHRFAESSQRAFFEAFSTSP